MIRLRLPLACPVNRLWRTVRGRPVLSKDARVKRDLLVATIHDSLGGRPAAMAGPVAVQMTVVPRQNKGRQVPDVDAYAKHVLDCMTHAGVWLDDLQVETLTIHRLAPEGRGHIDLEVWPIGQDSYQDGEIECN